MPERIVVSTKHLLIFSCFGARALGLGFMLLSLLLSLLLLLLVVVVLFRNPAAGAAGEQECSEEEFDPEADDPYAEDFEQEAAVGATSNEQTNAEEAGGFDVRGPDMANLAESAGEAVPSASVDVEVEGSELPPAAHDPVPEPPVPPHVPAERRRGGHRRADRHPKSFDFGCFQIRFREDASELYPDRVSSWIARCPVHTDDSVECIKTIQINQPDEDTSLRRLLVWCLHANRYATKAVPWPLLFFPLESHHVEITRCLRFILCIYLNEGTKYTHIDIIQFVFVFSLVFSIKMYFMFLFHC